jgi:hypothetical protein
VLTNVGDLANSIGQKLPEELDADAAKKQRDTAAADANETLKAAGEQFNGIGDLNVVFADTSRAGSIGQMLASAASGTVYQVQGDAAVAKQMLDQAKAVRDKLLENGTAGIPPLPPSLQGGVVPASATPATPGNVEKQ